jgi:acyl-CoA synthetase (NDP forming)
VSSLDALFAPRSVAVLGASKSPAKLGHRLLANVTQGGFAGAVHPVNPSGGAILGLPAIERVDALPAGVDLALVSLPGPAVPEAIGALAARGVRAAVVLSSGFGEVDGAGRGAQDALLAVARAAGMRLVGPNCMGVFSAPARLNGTYFWDLPRLPGGVAVVSQSGAYGGLIFRHLGSRGIGVARFLSIGNQADIDVAEALEYFAEDEATTLVACFIESIPDGQRFVRAARAASRRKPVVALKGGRSDAGRRAAGSHTGALAGSYDVYRAALRRAGVVVAEETEEFFDAVEALVVAGLRRPATPGVAIITVSGGPSVVAADCAERSGLAVPALDAATQGRLRALLPPFAAVANPVDLTPQVERARIAGAVREVLGHVDVGGAVAVDVGLDIAEFADALVAASYETGKAVVAFTADAPGVADRLRAGGVPVLPGPERAVRAWRALYQAARSARSVGPAIDASARDQAARGGWPGAEARAGAAARAGGRRAPALPRDLADALRATPGALPYPLARRLLQAFGVPFCREATAATVEEAAAAACGLGYPVVVKADAPGLAHKTEAGVVRLDVRSAGEVRAACEEFERRLGRVGFVVQERVGPGVELLVGARRDDVFGPVIALGTGGVLAEVIADVSLRLVPLEGDDAWEMLGEGLRPRLLAGPRGLPPVDGRAVVALLDAVAALMVAAPRIVEIDLNPVIAAAGRAVAVDALVVTAHRGDSP